MDRTRIVLLSAALAVGVMLLPTPSFARDFAYLDDRQLAALRALGTKIVLPAQLPPGYALAKLDIDGEARSYSLQFRGPAHHAMFVSVTVLEGGDAAPDYTSFRHSFDATSPVLGKAHFEPVHDLNGWSWVVEYLPLNRSHPTAPVMSIGGDSTSDLKVVYAALKPLPKR